MLFSVWHSRDLYSSSLFFILPFLLFCFVVVVCVRVWVCVCGGVGVAKSFAPNLWKCPEILIKSLERREARLISSSPSWGRTHFPPLSREGLCVPAGRGADVALSADISSSLGERWFQILFSPSGWTGLLLKVLTLAHTTCYYLSGSWILFLPRSQGHPKGSW